MISFLKECFEMLSVLRLQDLLSVGDITSNWLQV